MVNGQTAGWLRLALVAALSIAIACGEPGRERSSPASPPGRGVLRLLDLLPEATIEGPLLEVPTRASVEALEGPLATRNLWSEDFEGRGTSVPKGCQLADRGQAFPGGKALACTGRRIRFEVAAEPLTRYRTRHAQRGLSCYLSWVREYSQGNELFRHHPRTSKATRGWMTRSVDLLTSSKTDRLAISLEKARDAPCQGWLDDFSVEILDLTEKQELALLKGQSLAEGADPALGVAKHGILLPLGDPLTDAPPWDENFSARDALFAPPPTDLHFDLTVPPAARLTFSYALGAASRPGDSVVFQVLARSGDGTPSELFDQTLTIGPQGEGWHWHEARVDMGPFADQAVRLTLRTRGRGHGLWGSPLIDAPRAENDPPSVILIAVDTLRADRLSAYGYPRATSPNLEALAQDGVRFEQAISAANWTAPSFASLFTGLGAFRPSLRQMKPDRNTLAEQLRAAGWSTHAILYKPHLHDRGFDQGYDRYFSMPRYEVRADDNLDKAMAWLDDFGDRRGFLFLHFNDPHQPFTQPEESLTAGERRGVGRFGLKFPIMISSHAAWSTAEGRKETCDPCRRDDGFTDEFKSLASDLYDSEIVYADARIGTFLKALKERGLYRDALIAFLSDHGEALWDHQEQFDHGGPNLHDELVRVPLIVKPPSSFAVDRGRVVTSQVRLMDIMPTLLELAGLDPSPLSLDAESLVPLLRPSAGPSDRLAVSVDEPSGLVAVRFGGWKYIQRPRESGPPEEKLFDLRADPAEAHDVAASFPQRVEALRRQALERLLVERPGRTVVVTSDGRADREYEISIAWDDRAGLRSLVHPPLAAARGSKRVHQFRFQATGPLVLVAPFKTDGQNEVEVEVHAAGSPPFDLVKRGTAADFRPFNPGDLNRLQGPRAKPGIHLFETSVPQETETQEPPATEDARQLEALRALGYVN